MDGPWSALCPLDFQRLLSSALEDLIAKGPRATFTPVPHDCHPNYPNPGAHHRAGNTHAGTAQGWTTSRAEVTPEMMLAVVAAEAARQRRLAALYAAASALVTLPPPAGASRGAFPSGAELFPHVGQRRTCESTAAPKPARKRTLVLEPPAPCPPSPVVPSCAESLHVLGSGGFLAARSCSVQSDASLLSLGGPARRPKANHDALACSSSDDDMSLQPNLLHCNDGCRPSSLPPNKRWLAAAAAASAATAAACIAPADEATAPAAEGATRRPQAVSAAAEYESLPMLRSHCSQGSNADATSDQTMSAAPARALQLLLQPAAAATGGAAALNAGASKAASAGPAAGNDERFLAESLLALKHTDGLQQTQQRQRAAQRRQLLIVEDCHGGGGAALPQAQCALQRAPVPAANMGAASNGGAGSRPAGTTSPSLPPSPELASTTAWPPPPLPRPAAAGRRPVDGLRANADGVVIAKTLTVSDAAARRMGLPRPAVEAHMPTIVFSRESKIPLECVDKRGATWHVAVHKWHNGPHAKPVYALASVYKFFAANHVGAGDAVGLCLLPGGDADDGVRLLLEVNTPRVVAAALASAKVVSCPDDESCGVGARSSPSAWAPIAPEPSNGGGGSWSSRRADAGICGDGGGGSRVNAGQHQGGSKSASPRCAAAPAVSLPSAKRPRLMNMAEATPVAAHVLLL